MTMRRNLLQINPDPIKVVPAAQRDVWDPTRNLRWRCDHEDGRGRCASRETRVVYLKVERRSAAFCEKHMPEGER